MPRPLYTIAREIKFDWAKPYLDAMASLNELSDSYGADSARSIVAYFLANAQTWRGSKARELKAELRAMLQH